MATGGINGIISETPGGHLEGHKKMNNREIHYRYAISYLVFVSVAAIGFGLFDVPDLVDKVSFALTITSLVLGVVAIIYTFVAADKQDSQLSKLIETNFSISSASKEIETAASAIVDQVGVIPPRLDQLDRKIGALSPAAQAMPDKHPGGEAVELTDEQFRLFFSELTFAGMAALYLFYRAYQKGVDIDEELVEKTVLISFQYVLGLLNGAEAAQLLAMKYRSEAIIPISASEAFVKNILKEIDSVIEAMGEENPFLKNMKTAIDEALPNSR